MDKVAAAKLHNFSLALATLREALEKENKNTLEIDRTIQRFEFCFGLCWKTLKAVLEASGRDITVATPKAIFKEALSAGLIQEEKLWTSMLDDRNNMAHVYDKVLAGEIAARIPGYYHVMVTALNLMHTL